MRVQTTSYKVFAITPGATALVRPPTHGLLVCAAGNVTMVVEGVDAAGDPADVTITITGAAAGTRIELVPKKVTAATATVVGLF